MHLNRPEVLKVLTDLRNNVVKFVISFDYSTEAVINYATGDERISAFAKHFAEMDAPWTFGIDPTSAHAVKRCALGAVIATAYQLTNDFDAAHQLGHEVLAPITEPPH